MILTGEKWAEIVVILQADGYILTEDTLEKIVLNKQCNIGGNLNITYRPADEGREDMFQFTKRMAKNKPAKYAVITPTNVQQLYGAIALMETLV